jgi:very-short-patch-repair endonuclease
MGQKSVGEELVETWLTEQGIPHVREWRFHPIRRWRFDFVLGKDQADIEKFRLAIEVEGGAFTGGHKRGRAADSDCEKHNAAVGRGWKQLRFTTAMVKDGWAWPIIAEHWHDCAANWTPTRHKGVSESL